MLKAWDQIIIFPINISFIAGRHNSNSFVNNKKVISKITMTFSNIQFFKKKMTFRNLSFLKKKVQRKLLNTYKKYRKKRNQLNLNSQQNK